MATRVFVNYRRDDARDMAARVRDRLATAFGRSNVFMDVDNLMAGQRFDRELEKALSQTDVLLAVIGPRWLELLTERQRQGERDYVREEISGALQRGVTVIPVLVDTTPLPRRDDLPDDIRDLVFHQKHVVTHEQFGRDLAALTDAIRFSRQKPKQWPRKLALASAFALLAAAIGTGAYLGVPAAIEALSNRGEAPPADVASNSASVTVPAVENRPAPAQPERPPPPAPKPEARPAPAKETTRPAAPKPAPPAANPVALGRDYRMKLASSFFKGSGTVESFARDVATATEAKMKIETYGAGEVVPSSGVLDAVKAGAVDLGWTFASTYISKDPAFAVVGGSLPVGLNANRFADWLRGPGKSVRDRFYAPYGVKALACSFFGPKSLFLSKSVTTPDDFKGLKIRTTGLQAQALRRLGVATVLLPIGEIYAALDRGVIDGAELLTPTEDEKFGWTKLPGHYYYPFGEPTFSNVVELLVNKPLWDSLDPAARQVLETACDRHLLASLASIESSTQQALQRMVKSGARIAKPPEAVSSAYVQATSKMLDETIKSAAGRAVWQSLASTR